MTIQITLIKIQVTLRSYKLHFPHIFGISSSIYELDTHPYSSYMWPSIPHIFGLAIHYLRYIGLGMCSIWLVLVLRIETQANSKGIKIAYRTRVTTASIENRCDKWPTQQWERGIITDHPGSRASGKPEALAWRRRQVDQEISTGAREASNQHER